MQNKKSIYIIVVLLSATFIISLLSSYLSYASIKLVNSDVKTKTNIYTANLYVSYDKKNIVFNNETVYPVVNSITLNNSSNKVLKYKLLLTSITNIINNITYTIKKNDEVIISDILPSTDKILLDNITIEPNTTDIYTITFENPNNTEAIYTGVLKVKATT